MRTQFFLGLGLWFADLLDTLWPHAPHELHISSSKPAGCIRKPHALMQLEQRLFNIKNSLTVDMARWAFALPSV